MRFRHITYIHPHVRHCRLLRTQTIPEERVDSVYPLWCFLDETLTKNKSWMERNDSEVWILAG